MKMLKWTLLGLALGAGVWSLGCGGDDAPPPPQNNTFTVRNGTWQVHVNTTFTGVDSCLARTPRTVDTTDVICNVSIVSGGGTNFPFSCDIQQVGENVTFDCQLKVNLGICWQIADIKGSGTITDTTFNIGLSLAERITPQDPNNAQTCELLYGSFADECTTHVASQGSWMNTGPTCSINGPEPVPPSATKYKYAAIVSLNGLSEASYHWTIAGNGSIFGSATKDTVQVSAPTAGKFFLTLDVGRGCLGHSCVDTVIVSSAAASSPVPDSSPASIGLEAAGGSPEEATPFSELLSHVIQLALSPRRE